MIKAIKYRFTEQHKHFGVIDIFKKKDYKISSLTMTMSPGSLYSSITFKK